MGNLIMVFKLKMIKNRYFIILLNKYLFVNGGTYATANYTGNRIKHSLHVRNASDMNGDTCGQFTSISKVLILRFYLTFSLLEFY